MAQTMTCGTCKYTSADDKEFRVVGTGAAVLLTSVMNRGMNYQLSQYEDFCSITCALQYVEESLKGEGLPMGSRKTP